MIQTESS